MDTKGIIIEAMRKLLRQRRFEKITVQDILDTAHCSRGTFYRHFKDKFEIMNYFYKESTRSIVENTEMDGRTKTEAIIATVLKNRDYFGGVVDAEGVNSFKTFVEMCSRQYYLSVYRQKHGEGPVPDSISFMADFVAAGCATTIDAWVIHSDRLSKDQLVDCLYKMTPDVFR